jgi:general secretion pathway protein K
LLDKRQNRRPRIDGTPIKFVFDGIEFDVEIQDESGRIDINHVDTPLLAGLLRALGERAEDADRIADRILDWRDADDLRRLNGAEAQDYRVAGRSLLPRNGPFPSVEELQLVLGMTPAMFQRLKPALTVSSGRPMADPRIALPLIQRALSGNDAARTVSRPTNGGILTGPLEGRAFAIKIGFRLNNRQIRREAVIRVVGAASQPYWLLRWRKHPAP